MPSHPRVYFEEWDEPMISAIGWVSELIAVAGGVDIFTELSSGSLARERFVVGAEVVRRKPDIILGSWCGKRFRAEQVSARPGWQETPAVRAGQLHEIKSPLILQPGPAALTDGVAAMHRIFSKWASQSA
jgi:iron complex transport system substrate-binding protein